jgi:hypothetical protein
MANCTINFKQAKTKKKEIFAFNRVEINFPIIKESPFLASLTTLDKEKLAIKFS